MEKEKYRFLKSENGTIYDSQTSLTWMANYSRLDLEKEISWDETERYVVDINGKEFGGHKDWRIPSAQETCGSQAAYGLGVTKSGFLEQLD